MDENKTNINWYPGHMAKTKKQIIEDLKLVDVVIELLDARIPISSQNPEKINIPAIETDSNRGNNTNQIIKMIEKIMEENLKAQSEKGRIRKTIRVMIVGIPNVGKSSFINRIAQKNATIVGNKPGVTKQKQWIRIGNQIELLDTPGVLWPKFESEEVGLKLAYTGSIKEEVFEKTEVAFNLLKYLDTKYSKLLYEKYKITDEEIENIKRTQNYYLELMYLIGRKRGALISGGNIDEEKVAKIILDEFKNGKIGNITIEKEGKE